MSDDNQIIYPGHERFYKPDIGNAKQSPRPRFSNQTGYHNLALLRSLIDKILQETETVIKDSEQELSAFSLKVQDGSKLQEAHLAEWPSNMSDPKDYVSYAEYKALESVDTRGAHYVRKVYEDHVRGPYGSNAIDVILGSKSIRQEALHIKEFLDDSIGDSVSDTSEHRTLELLQDWAETAFEYARGFGVLRKARIEKPSQIPSSELDTLSPTKATEYQAIFKVKANSINNDIAKKQEELSKEFDQFSEVYYKRFLGPSLKFRKQVTSNVESEISGGSFLGSQIREAAGALNHNVSSLLADQMRRNDSFSSKVYDLLAFIRGRDNYVGFIEQLGTVGKTISSPFTQVDLDPEEIEGFKTFVAEVQDKKAASNPFSSMHNEVVGRDADDAHDQYLNRKGGNVVGDVTLDDNVKIDGMRPGGVASHHHQGVDVDGTNRIQGKDIEDLVTTAIDRNELMCYPINLRHINNQPHTGTNNVTLVNSQISWDCDPNLTFELQVVPIDGLAAGSGGGSGGGGGGGGGGGEDVSYCVTTLYETDLDIIAGVGSDFNFFTFATATAVYIYNWTTGILTLIAGQEGTFGDGSGDSITKARFANIKDITQDYFDGRIYIVDGDNRKVKMTGKATTSGVTLPTDITTMYRAPYPIKRIDTQGQNFLNTMYVLEGPDNGGFDRVVKLVDKDGNNLQAGTYESSVITDISGKYEGVTDIAATPNGSVYLLIPETEKLIQYIPEPKTVRTHDIADSSNAAPTAITSDQFNNIYITYSG